MRVCVCVRLNSKSEKNEYEFVLRWIWTLHAQFKLSLLKYCQFKSLQADSFLFKYNCRTAFIVKDICMCVSEVLLQSAREVLGTG